MSLSGLKVKGDLWTGIAIGVGLMAAPVVIPLVGSAARILLKEILTAVFTIVEEVQATAERVVSTTGELIDEVEAEMSRRVD
jgi:hypothetical protein